MSTTSTPEPRPAEQSRPAEQRRPDRRAALVGGLAGAGGAVLAVALIVFFAIRAGG